jgi:hypothetical protein
MDSIWSHSIIKSGSMPERIDILFRRLILFLFENVLSILFHIIFPNFKVLDIILERIVIILFKDIFSILFYIIFCFGYYFGESYFFNFM